MPENTLYYGDNLDVLRRYVADESVDLVYLDPPFNSARDYNVLFESKSGKDSTAQIAAFEDTWKWDMAAAAQFEETLSRGGKVADVLNSFRTFLGTNDMLAYLTMMAPRLIELHRALKPTGSLYLHCDPTASHYLKLLLDAVFTPQNFRSEIVWKRSSAHNDGKQGRKIHGHIHDVILFYTKGEEWTWNQQFVPYDSEYLEAEYRHKTKDGRYYKETDLTAAKPGGDVSYDWHVLRRDSTHDWTPDLDGEWQSPVAGTEYLAVKPYNGRYWAYSRANLEQFAREGHLIHRSTGMPRLVQYADEMPGIALQDVWTDVPPIAPRAAERLGYPTQKPVALLDRILRSSSNPGDVVLDPFCGCGTTIASAQANGRRWIGIDITHLAVGLIRNRLQDSFGESATFKVVGEPTTIEDAERLREEDKFQFQAWALGLVGARLNNSAKKGADKGIDGRLYFQSGEGAGKMDQVIISVKGGGLKADDLRALAGVVEREKAAIGVLMTFDKPSSKMKTDAASFGFHHTRWGNFPRIQIITVEELLDGARIQYPHMTGGNVTVKRAPKVQKPDAEKLSLFES